MRGRKSQVRALAMQGLTQREIAAELNISRTGVRGHLQGWTNPNPKVEPVVESPLDGWNDDPLTED